MATDTTLRNLADTLLDNPAVSGGIDSIIRELREAQSSITGVRPPAEELRVGYEQYLAQVEKDKGRKPVFPYVGSGLGNGPLVELADGSVKWDMINGIGVSMFGHSHPGMTEAAIRGALADTVMQGNLQFNREAIDFAQLLVEEAGRTSRITKCFLTNSGAMANESALKVCLQKTGGKAPRILAFSHNFMGRTIVLSQIGDSAAGRVGIPLNVQVDYMPFYDPQLGQDSIDDALSRLQEYIDRYPGQHACFAMELIQGEGGFNIGSREFFEPLMKLCRENDIPVMVDEIQTFGRTETMFHFESLGLGEYVDVVTIGKMSQVCACLYTEDMNPKPGLLSGTFIGSSVGLQVGKKMLETMRDGGYYGPDGRIATLHQAFRQRAESLVKNHSQFFGPIPNNSGLERHATGPPGPYGGIGGMMRFTPFGGDKAMILKSIHAMFEEGVIAFYCGHGPFHIRFLAPVGVMEPEQFDDVFAIVERALDKAAG